MFLVLYEILYKLSHLNEIMMNLSVLKKNNKHFHCAGNGYQGQVPLKTELSHAEMAREWKQREIWQWDNIPLYSTINTVVASVTGCKEICEGQSHWQEMINLGEKDSQGKHGHMEEHRLRASVAPEGRKNIREYCLVIKELCSVSSVHKSMDRCGRREPLKCRELLLPHCIFITWHMEDILTQFHWKHEINSVWIKKKFALKSKPPITWTFYWAQNFIFKVLRKQ